MAGYGGYFLQGLSSGISQGMDWGQQILDIRERKKAKDELKSLQDKISVASTDFTKMVNQYGADNMYSDKEMLDLQTFAFGIGAEFQEMVKPIIQNIEQGNTGQVKEQIKQIDDYVSYIFSLNLQPGQVEQAISNFKNSKQWSESAQRYWDAEEAMVKSMAEARQMQPEQPQTAVYPTPQALLAENPGAGYEFNSSANGYVVKMPEPEKEGTPLSQKDIMAINLYEQKKIGFDAFLKYMGMYIEPNKQTDLEKKIDMAINLGATQEDIKNMLLGKGTAPEGNEEVTAGQKRVVDMGNQILFGESDILSGIQKPGLISGTINRKLNSGQGLTPEESKEVLQSWSYIKDSYEPSVQNYVEAQLQRYGITEQTNVIPEPTPEPTPTPESQPNALDKIINWGKNQLGLGGEVKEPPPETPAEPVAPKNPALHTPEINTWIENDKKYIQQNPDAAAAFQKTLKEKGYWDYEITGRWTELLENALRMFYKENPQG
jgi:hypothetical protein